MITVYGQIRVFFSSFLDASICHGLFSLLFQARMEVDDLFVDLADGKKLLKLLEIISGEKLGKPNNGKMRVHKVENVNKSLAFLQTKKVRELRKIVDEFTLETHRE